MSSSSSLHFLHNALTSTSRHHRYLGFSQVLSPSQSLFSSVSFSSNFENLSSREKLISGQSRKSHKGSRPKQGVLRVKGNKENIWSVDNELAKAEKYNERTSKIRPKGRRVVKRKRSKGGRVIASGAMLMEVENVLQTQEPVIRPSWATFASSVSGIWKGVGAIFSPITAEMEPIDIGNKNENLYDCYTLSHVEAVPSLSGGPTSQIKRKVNWVTLNPCGEEANCDKDASSSLHGRRQHYVFPTFESFDFQASEVMEEDIMGNEPGLVSFEDGSYSRGPVDIPVGEVDESNYYLSPTFKFEQCLVKGCHKRLRIVHTIEFGNGGSDIQIMRVAIYEEQWVSPANLRDDSDVDCELKPFSTRKRTTPSELTGSWKVFEVSATPIFGEEPMDDTAGPPFVYLCMETLKKRNLPDNQVSFGEEEMADMQDVVVLWLPGGVTGYVDVKKDGVLCIGVGWYSDEGINLVMERDYGVDGKLKEIRWNTEVKRRWSDHPLPL